jgi:hypothetical protein
MDMISKKLADVTLLEVSKLYIIRFHAWFASTQKD